MDYVSSKLQLGARLPHLPGGAAIDFHEYNGVPKPAGVVQTRYKSCKKRLNYYSIKEEV